MNSPCIIPLVRDLFLRVVREVVGRLLVGRQDVEGPYLSLVEVRAALRVHRVLTLEVVGPLELEARLGGGVVYVAVVV